MLVYDDFLGTSAAYQDSAGLAQHSFENPRALTRFAKRATKVYLAYLKVWSGFRRFQIAYDQEAAALGISFTAESEPPIAPDIYACYQCHQCSATFDTYHKLCTHAFRQHQQPNMAQRYVANNVCRACLKVYQGRQQVIHHLKYMRTGCLVKLAMTTVPMSDADLAEILAEQQDLQKQAKKQMRKTVHKVPMCRAAGPLLPWPWQRSLARYLQDTRWQEPPDDATWTSVVGQVLQATSEGDLDAAYQVLQSVAYHGTLAHELVQTMLQSQAHPVTPAQAHQQVLVQEAITLWQDNHLVPPSHDDLGPSCPQVLASLQSLRATPVASAPLPLSQVLKRQVVSDQLWKDDLVTHQLQQQVQQEHKKQLTVFPLCRTLIHCKPVFLYIFSGRRREGDFQFQIEKYLDETHQEGQVLLVDLALSPKHDVYQEELLRTFKTWIAEGWVAGLLLAPPCETWSEVRNVVI
eukprot:Skav232205  [mRNA]  locus=scaffold2626:124620:126008:+ [translate_table: standard]